MHRRRLRSRPPFAALLVATLLATAAPAASATLPPPPDPLDLVAQPDRKPPQQAAERRVDRTFKVATLNILGSQHTRGGDRARTVRTARLLEERNVALAGLQEVQEDQLGWLKEEMRGYRVWPGTRYGPQGMRLQIAWRKERFRLLDHGSITTTFSRQQRPVPWVRLKDERTGRRLSVIDLHNSPDTQEAARDAATREEIDLYRRLRERGPVVILGDANERGEWFCKLTGATDARAANGGRNAGGSCRPPRPTYVDWLMGRGGFEWRRYRAAENSVSDHLLHTSVLRWRG